MNRKNKKCLPLRMAGAALALWAILMALMVFAQNQGGGLLILAFLLVLLAAGGRYVRSALHGSSAAGPNAPWASARVRALRRRCSALCAAALCLVMLPVLASAAISGSLDVSGLAVSDSTNNGTAPSSGSGGAATSAGWTASGTVLTGVVTPGYTSETSGGGCGGGSSTTYYYYTSASSTLTLTNNSGEEAILSFDYTATSAGTLTIDGAARTAGGSFSKTLGSGETVAVVLTTPSSAASTSSESAGSYAASTTLSGISLTPVNTTAAVTLSPVSAGGSYTAQAASTSLTVGETYEYPVTTSYTFTAAASVNYQFDGWYVNGEKVSDTVSYTRTFSADATVEARFALDPLYSVTSVTDGEGAVSDYLEVNSSYYHLATGTSMCRHTNVGDLNTNNSYGAYTYFPYLEWSASGNGVQSGWSGEVTGDNQTSMGYSNARAWLYSDVIRIRAAQTCTLTFDLSISASSVDDHGDYPSVGVYAYTYVTTSASASTSTITSNGTLIAGGAKSSSGSSSQEVSLNAGDYLYIYTRAETLNSSIQFSGYCTDDASYSASISNVTVAPNTTTYDLTLGNRDNIGTVLASGSIRINGVTQSVASGSYSDAMAGASVLTLTPGTAPSGYVFIGWHNVTDDTYLYTDTEYTLTMTGDTELHAIYVPAMTITTGGTNGYESASYTYRTLSGSTAVPDGQYVARNASCTAFYASLAQAFSETDTVVLLAGDTIQGDLTVPAGKTLVIPCSLTDAGPLEPAQVTSTSSMSNYCTVTYGGGTLTVDGALVVSAAQSGASPLGISSGGIGYLALEDSARMTVNGTLGVSGLIRGGEQITVTSGGTVYELMVIADFRALLLTESFISDERVFPFNNFYIKNIEDVPVTYQAGANLYARYSMRLQGMTVNTTGVIPVIGTSGALFNITQGTFTKMFDRSTDKTVYRLDEHAVGSSGSFSLTLTYSLSGLSQTMTVDTADYLVPLNAGFDIQIDGDFTINSDFKFLPGANLSVGETGVCTVASGRNVILYRLNDYDIRSGGSGNTFRGFSSTGYPVSARNYPAGGYSHPTIDTVGSAKLNVDGQMIVNGGLYVTDMLCEEAYSSGYKENGYNVLTGTGSIDFTGASSALTYIEEGMQASGSNDPQYVQVTVTPVAGLSADATADSPDFYTAFADGSVYYGAYRPLDGGIYIWSDTPFTEVAAICTSDGSDQSYLFLADAIAVYDAGVQGQAETDAGLPYIVLLEDTTESGFTIDKPVYLDLNGKTVTIAEGQAIVIDGGSLYGMDSATDEYTDDQHGSIVGTITGEAVTAHETFRKTGSRQRYVAYTDGSSTSFHRYNMSVTNYQFYFNSETDDFNLTFGTTFRGSPTVVSLVEDMGFRVTKVSDGASADGWWTEQNGGSMPEITNGYVLQGTLVNIGAGDDSGAFSEYYQIFALLRFTDRTEAASVPRELNYLWALKQYYNSAEATEEQKALIEEFLNAKSLWDDWNAITN